VATKEEHMRTKSRLTLVAALAVGSIPMAGAAAFAHGEPACDDPVAGVIHEVEEATHLYPLHELEEAYCAL
jgi:hypothetical protein